jgi:hypothetical protein
MSSAIVHSKGLPCPRFVAALIAAPTRHGRTVVATAREKREMKSDWRLTRCVPGWFSKPDAILRHVASWGDRFPMARMTPAGVCLVNLARCNNQATEP